MSRLVTMRNQAVILTLIVVSPSAHAYLDPGTGSMLLQFLIAGILGALFTIKMWWYRFKLFFARLMGKDVSDPHDQEDTSRAPEDEKHRSPE